MATTPLAGITATFERWGILYDDGDVIPGHVRGEFAPRFVMVHHTAGSVRGPEPSREVVREGRPDVPPPLYQLVLTRDLLVDVVSFGRANHAGKGGPWKPRAGGEGIPKDLGNRLSVGVAFEHSGKEREVWDPRYVAFGVLVVAAVCDHLSVPAAHVLAHKEYTPRKPDPLLDMTAFRARVDSMIRTGPRAAEQEDDDMITPGQLRELLETTELGLGPANAGLLGQPDKDISLDGLLVAIAGNAAATNRALADTNAKLDALIKLYSQTPPVLGDGL